MTVIEMGTKQKFFLLPYSFRYTFWAILFLYELPNVLHEPILKSANEYFLSDRVVMMFGKHFRHLDRKVYVTVPF